MSKELIEALRAENERLRLNIAEYNEHERCYRSEIERLTRTIDAGIANELALVGERISLRSELATLKAQPSGVVLPERISIAGHLTVDSSYRASGWNACLDEVARLNSSPVSAGEPCMCGGNPHTTQCLYEHFLSYSGLADQPTLRYTYFHGAGFAAEIDQPSAGGVDERE